MASLPLDAAARVPPPELGRLEPASLLDVGQQPAPALDTPVAEPERALLGVFAQAVWGGEYVTTTGETVRLFVSDSYPRNDTFAQTWANFLASLVHGPELARVRVYLAPLQEVQSLCGRFALACYSSRAEQIVSVGEDVPTQGTAEGVLAHEYGHHIARNRSNPPWSALTHGPKRWASSIGVCARTRAGTLFPGGQGRRYQLSPAEGFAESYRVLNERRLGRPESPWAIVSRSLYPTDAVLRQLEQDVVAPWSGNVVVTRGGRFSRGATTRSFVVSTPYDGRFQVRLRAADAGRYRVTILSRAGRTLGAGTGSAQTTICGQRSVVVWVSHRGARATATLAISRP